MLKNKHVLRLKQGTYDLLSNLFINGLQIFVDVNFLGHAAQSLAATPLLGKQLIKRL